MQKEKREYRKDRPNDQIIIDADLKYDDETDEFTLSSKRLDQMLDEGRKSEQEVIKRNLIAYLKGRESMASKESNRLHIIGNQEEMYFKGRADAFLTIADFIKGGKFYD